MPRRLQALATVSWILLIAGAGAPAQQPQTDAQQAGSGLAPSVAMFPNLSIASGNVLCSNATATYAGGGVGTITNGVNYVYFDCGTSVPKSSASPFTGGRIPLAVVVARSSSYGTSELLDVRPWAVTRTGPALLVTDFPRGAQTGPQADAPRAAAHPASDPNVTTDGFASANYLALFTSSTNIEDSAISQSSGNIGIGTTTPGAPLTVGNASPVLLDTFGTSSPNSFASLNTNASYLSVNHPDFFMSRNDTSSSPTCVSGWFAPCDSPMAELEVTNANTGFIPNVSALDIVAGGFNATDPYHNQPANSNFTFALGTRWEDTNSDNVTIGRAQNVIAVVKGNPTTPAAGGFTRTVAGIEIDVSNQSGNPAVPFGGSPPGGCSYGSTCGNVLGGMSIVQTYGPDATDAIGIGSSSNIPNAGFLHGLDISGISGDCAICLYKGGPGGGVSPTEAIHVETDGSYGLVVGSGTVVDTPSSGVTPGHPTTGILLDATGASASRSNTLDLRSTDSGSAHDWFTYNDAGQNLQFDYGSVIGTHEVTLASTGNVLNVAGTTGLTWTYGTGVNNLGLATFGTPGTGGSLYVNTASGSSTYQSGLGIDGTYGTPALQSAINLKALGVKSGGGYGSQLAFWTTKGTTLNQQMTLDMNGNVGIGTTSPVSALNVAGTTGITWTYGGGVNNLGLVTIGTGGTSGGSLYVNTASGSSTYQSGLGVDGTYGTPAQQSVINIRALGVKSGGGYGSQLAFWTTSGTTQNQQMTINTGGFVSMAKAMGANVYSATCCSPAFDASQGNTQTVTLTGNVTGWSISYPTSGEWLIIQWCQDATGGRTVLLGTQPSNVKGFTPVAAGAPASSCSQQIFFYNGTNWYALAIGTSNL